MLSTQRPRKWFFGAPERRPVHVRAEATHVETWSSIRVQAGGIKTVAGWLEKVDLRSHEFRVRDDVGQAVDLTRVENDAVAAKLVGQWVIAEGEALVRRFRPSALPWTCASVLRAWIRPPSTSVAAVCREEILASAPGPNMDGGIELTR